MNKLHYVVVFKFLAGHDGAKILASKAVLGTDEKAAQVAEDMALANGYVRGGAVKAGVFSSPEKAEKVIGAAIKW
jgi:hypothetical protein